MRYILAIDQGTTGTRAVVFDEKLNQRWSSYMEHRQISPQPGWTEHDPMEILENTCTVIRQVLEQAQDAGVRLEQIVCAGMANQGETTVAWDRITGEPLSNAVVWHCTRSSQIAQRLQAVPGFDALVRERTGLMIDSYFSATKMVWLRENVPAVRQALEEGRALFGTLDSWLIWKLTQRQSYVTDAATASRTMLFNIHTMDWDDDILAQLELSRSTLPQVLNNCAAFGTAKIPLDGGVFELPILGSIVDQQGALFGQFCFDAGMIKATYGTGCFVLMNTGDKPVYSQHGLLTSVGWQLADRKCYVLDGAIYMAGAVMQWLRDKLGLIEQYSDLDRNALSLPDNGGVYFVTAFSGLSAPIWDPNARGTIVGMTTNTTRAHVVRAALESVAYQVKQLLDCFQSDTRLPLQLLRADGGITRSMFLMQFQADLLDLPVTLMRSCEATAKGVAMLAGLQAGIFSGLGELSQLQETDRIYRPDLSVERRSQLLRDWSCAVERARGWENRADS